jgi:hypothetical protein
VAATGSKNPGPDHRQTAQPASGTCNSKQRKWLDSPHDRHNSHRVHAKAVIPANSVIPANAGIQNPGAPLSSPDPGGSHSLSESQSPSALRAPQAYAHFKTE